MTGEYERRGIWCGQTATSQPTTAKPRHLESNESGNGRQPNTGDNGYDQLCDQQGWIATTEGFRWVTVHWATLYDVALKYVSKGKAQDAEDLLHTILETLAVAERNNGHKPFTLGTMHRIARRCVADYWFDHYSINNGLDCRHCSKTQRAKCKEGHLYAECSRAITLEHLSKPIIDSEGNMTQLGELIADPDSLDPQFWDKGSVWQLGYKPRLVAIANKLKTGEALTGYDRIYLNRYRKDQQKKLLQ
ncbi:hypothetical protein ACFLW7_04715 [Chloroflexota bacterium]